MIVLAAQRGNGNVDYFVKGDGYISRVIVWAIKNLAIRSTQWLSSTVNNVTAIARDSVGK